MKKYAVFFLMLLLIIILISSAVFGLSHYLMKEARFEPVSPDDLSAISDMDAPPDCGTSSSHIAYRIHAQTDSELNGQMIYQSALQFDMQLEHAQSNIFKGMASNIRIREQGHEDRTDDIYFLTRADTDKYLIFGAFNDLGLHKKHPAVILSQVLKALSTGKTNTKYTFPYDPLQRSYEYVVSPSEILRYSQRDWLDFRIGANNERWQIQYGDDCAPERMLSVEEIPMSVTGHDGYIRFTLRATRIPAHTSIPDGQHYAGRNTNNVWQTAHINSSEFSSDIQSEEHMWEIIRNFGTERNTSSLIKAAEFMIDHVPAQQLAEYLYSDTLHDTEKRTALFALSLTTLPDTEQYLLHTLHSMPVQADDHIDMQSVRIMVALSGNPQVTPDAFQSLSAISQHTDYSRNVSDNALIAMGTISKHLEATYGNQTESTELRRIIQQRLNTDEDATSALLASGNAGLEGMDNLYREKLSSDTTKERYAAAMVLARNPEHYSEIISHIATEPSDLVTNIILSTLNPQELTPYQIQQLEMLLRQEDTDREKLIRRFLDNL